jgi:hypothetical protein
VNSGALTRQPSRDDQSDHAANFALTAWHLANWVFHSPRFAELKEVLTVWTAFIYGNRIE